MPGAQPLSDKAGTKEGRGEAATRGEVDDHSSFDAATPVFRLSVFIGVVLAAAALACLGEIASPFAARGGGFGFASFFLPLPPLEVVVLASVGELAWPKSAPPAPEPPLASCCCAARARLTISSSSEMAEDLPPLGLLLACCAQFCCSDGD